MNTSEHDCQDLAATGLKSYTFFLKTWHAKFWNVTFLQLHVPKSWQWLHYSRRGFQVFKLVGVTNFNIRPLPRIMSFMTWPSKTWTQLEKVFQDLAATFLKSNTLCSRLGVPSFVMLLHFFATPCPQALTMIALFKTWLSKSWFFFGGIEFLQYK